MLAIYSNNIVTDEIIEHCKFVQPYEIFRSIDQYVNSDAVRKLAFINCINQFDPPKNDQDHHEQMVNGTRFCQEIEQTKYCSEAVFALDNEFHAYHLDILKIHNQSNIYWILPVYPTACVTSAINILPYNVQFHYQLEPYQQRLNHKLHELTYHEHKPFYFDALLGLSRPFRDFVFDAVNASNNREKFLMTYGARPGQDTVSKYHWEPEVEFASSFWSSVTNVNYLGENLKVSLIVPITIYNQCAYSIITETNAFNEYSFFTEKIAKALLAKRLFVVFSGYNFLNNLQKLGFRTFGNVIDESYDNIIDDKQRWAAAFEQVEKLCNMDQLTVQKQIESTIDHNYQLLMNTNWHLSMLDNVKHVVDNLQNPFQKNTMTQKFKNSPWHPGASTNPEAYYVNTTREFMPPDSKENFEKLCEVPEYHEYFKNNGWLEPGAITYDINSYGFRCAEFDDQDCMLALGCSFTIGIGLPLDSTWPQIVGKQLGLVPYTMAWGGASADTCFRLAEYWIPKLKPKAVFVLAPPPARFELIKAVGYPPVENYLPQGESHSTTEIDSFLKHWHTMDENSRLNYKKNKLAIKAICAELDIPCFVYDVLDHMAKPREEVGYARDRMHAGPVGHSMLAERMLNDWSKK